MCKLVFSFFCIFEFKLNYWDIKTARNRRARHLILLPVVGLGKGGMNSLSGELITQLISFLQDQTLVNYFYFFKESHILKIFERIPTPDEKVFIYESKKMFFLTICTFFLLFSKNFGE